MLSFINNFNFRHESSPNPASELESLTVEDCILKDLTENDATL